MILIEPIEIEQHKLIIKYSKELLKVCFKNDIDYLQKIIKKSEEIIKDYNNTNLTVTDITKKEKGIWKAAVKKIVYGKYCNHIIKKIQDKISELYNDDYICDDHKDLYTSSDGTKDWFYNVDKFCDTCKKEHVKRDIEQKKYQEKIDNIREEFKKACNKTFFSYDLMLKFILLNRKIENICKTEPLQLAIKETIHNEILNTFQNQNKELIIKYI